MTGLPRRANVGALALLHALLLLAAPIADAVTGAGGSGGPHFEEARSECRGLDDHFCCTFCRVITSAGPRPIAPSIPFVRTAPAIAQITAIPIGSRPVVALPLGARAPPRVSLALRGV